jgi:multidrug efflux system membrane fusion protein
VQPRPIELEATEAELSIVRKGLSEGEQVVVDGQNQLRAGSKVIPRQAGQPGRAPREGELQQGSPARDGGPRADTPRQPRGARQ